MGSLNAPTIASLFNSCFAAHPLWACQMWRGGDEPLYEPAHAGRSEACIFYARDLAQSCLHEAAHWLYAGTRRRLLTDYGYWYQPDGRDLPAQRAFEKHEVPVQAREWILSNAARVPFRISVDNLMLPEPSAAFIDALVQETQRLLHGHWNQRMRILFQALCAYTEQTAASVLQSPLYSRESIAGEPGPCQQQAQR